MSSCSIKIRELFGNILSINEENISDKYQINILGFSIGLSLNTIIYSSSQSWCCWGSGRNHNFAVLSLQKGLNLQQGAK